MTLVQRFYAGQKITDQEIISLIPSDEISQGEKNLLMACLFAKTDQEKQAFRNEIGSLQKRNDDLDKDVQSLTRKFQNQSLRELEASEKFEKTAMTVITLAGATLMVTAGVVMPPLGIAMGYCVYDQLSDKNSGRARRPDYIDMKYSKAREYISQGYDCQEAIQQADRDVDQIGEARGDFTPDYDGWGSSSPYYRED